MKRSYTRKENNRVGEIHKSSKGEDIKIVRYANSLDVDVEFLSDGFIRKNLQYSAVKFRQVTRPKNKIRIGDKQVNSYGQEMKVIKIVSPSKVEVKFKRSSTKICTNYNFLAGRVKCNDLPTVKKVGITRGRVKDELSKDIKRVWLSMISKCYDLNGKSVNGFEVCREWKDFLKFKEWYVFNMDKKQKYNPRITRRTSKIFSPENCILVYS